MNTEPRTAKDIFVELIGTVLPDQWESRLDQMCAGDEELRNRVRALLRAHAEPGSFLEQPAIADPNSPPRSGDGRGEGTIDSLPIAERVGTVIGPYKLLQQIGEGGMGVVFMAEQTEPIQRTVALKIIKPGMDTRQVIARFEAERQAVAMMDHPNIAKVLDAGTTGAGSTEHGAGSPDEFLLHAPRSPLPATSGRPYFVMELVKGVPITKYCDDKHLPLPARLELFIQVCQAVQHAHQKGIIHRDIKPNNVLVAEYDNRAVPKVIDFGVAKATAHRLTERTMFTEFGQVLGTMEYMSPEQSKFNQLDIDTRSDIYSLGVLLYELLAGSTPFEGKRLHAAAFDEMLRIIREEEPPKPSTRLSSLTSRERLIDSLPLAGRAGEGVPTTLASIAANRHTEPARLSKDVQGELDWIVMKALEKDRNRRYETASGFAADIERHLHDEPVAARPASNLYRFRKTVRRNKAAFAAAGAVVAALVVGLGLSTWLFVRERTARQRAVVAERLAEIDKQKAKTEAAKSELVAQFMTEMLKGVGPSVALGRDTTMLREILDRIAQRLNKLNEQPVVKANLLTTLGSVYYDLGAVISAEKMHREALALRRGLFGDEHPDVAIALNRLAEALRQQHRFSEAEPLFRQALAIRRKLLGDEHPAVAQSLSSLGGLYLRQNNGRRAESFYRRVLALQHKQPTEARPNIASTLDLLALSLTFQGKYGEADELCRQALAIRLKRFGHDHPAVAHSHHNRAVLLASQGELDEAEKLFRKSLAMRRKFYGDVHLELVDSLEFFAESLREQGKLAEAETLSREALAMRKKLFDNSANSRPVGRLFTLGRICEAQGKFDEAEEVFREIIAMDATEPRHRGDSFYGLCMAMAHWKLGHKGEARNWYDQAVEWMQKNNPDNEELRRFRAEAAELLGITEPKPESALVQPADDPAEVNTPTTTSQPTTDD